jgi:hypothetical protein
VRLVIRRSVDAVNARLQVSTSHSRKCITNIDRDGLILRLHPLPLTLRVLDLQRRDRLSVQKGYRPKVCMARRVKISNSMILFDTPGGVMHVPHMILALDVILMLTDELVFVWELQDDGEELEELDYDFLMALPAEVCDLVDMFLEHRWLGSLVVPIELRNVVDLNVVPDGICEPANQRK